MSTKISSKYLPVSEFVNYLNLKLGEVNSILQVREFNQNSFVWKKLDRYGDYVILHPSIATNELKKNNLTLNKLLKDYGYKNASTPQIVTTPIERETEHSERDKPREEEIITQESGSIRRPRRTIRQEKEEQEKEKQEEIKIIEPVTPPKSEPEVNYTEEELQIVNRLLALSPSELNSLRRITDYSERSKTVGTLNEAVLVLAEKSKKRANTNPEEIKALKSQILTLNIKLGFEPENVDSIIDRYRRNLLKNDISSTYKEHYITRGSQGMVLGGETKIHTQNQIYKARYVIVELLQLTASNVVPSFKPSRSYPKDCQQRNYTEDTNEQLKVLNNAKDFNPLFLTSLDPTASNGAPIVARINSKLIVLGGNSRVMTLKLLASEGRFKEYKRACSPEYLKSAGFAAFYHERVFTDETDTTTRLEEPVVVRLLEEVVESCATFSNDLNTNLTQGQDPTTQAFSLAKQLSPADIKNLVLILEDQEIETLAELFTPKNTSKLIAIFRASKVINSTNQSIYITGNNEFTTSGKEFLKRILLGLFIEDKNLLEAVPSFADKIILTLPTLISFAGLEDFQVKPLFVEAIKLEYNRRQQNAPDIDFYLNSKQMFESEIDKNVVVIWRKLSGSASEFKYFIKNLYKICLQQDSYKAGNFSFNEKTFTLDEVIDKISKISSLNDEFKISSLEDISGYFPDPMPINDVELRNFLNLPKKFSMLIWGRPGQKKSTFALRLADRIAYATNDLVLYIATEEFVGSGTITQRAKLMRVSSKDLMILDTNNFDFIGKSVKSGLYKNIIIDSISAIPNVTPSEWRVLLESNPNINFIFIAHSTKDNKTARGIVDLEYWVDIVIKASDGALSTIKNRFAPLQSYNLNS